MKISKIHITISVFSLLSLALILFFILPAYNEIKSNSNKILEYKSDLISIREQNEELGRFKAKYETDAFDLEKIKGYFIDGKNPVEFITFIEKSADDSNVTIEIKLDVPSYEMSDANNMLLQVFAKGSFAGIIEFANKLENGPYLAMIEKLSIKKSLSGDDSSESLAASFLIEATLK